MTLLDMASLSSEVSRKLSIAATEEVETGVQETSPETSQASYVSSSVSSASADEMKQKAEELTAELLTEHHIAEVEKEQEKKQEDSENEDTVKQPRYYGRPEASAADLAPEVQARIAEHRNQPLQVEALTNKAEILTELFAAVEFMEADEDLIGAKHFRRMTNKMKGSAGRAIEAGDDTALFLFWNRSDDKTVSMVEPVEALEAIDEIEGLVERAARKLRMDEEPARLVGNRIIRSDAYDSIAP